MFGLYFIGKVESKHPHESNTEIHIVSRVGWWDFLLILPQEHLRHLAAWQTGNLAGLGSDLATGNLAEMDHIDGFLWENLRA